MGNERIEALREALALVPDHWSSGSSIRDRILALIAEDLPSEPCGDREDFLDALRDIDAVGVDFGHFESAARTMQEIARKALGYEARQ